MKCNLFVSMFLLFSIASNHLDSQNLKEGITNYYHSLSQYPQEKLYLHLDKPYYAAGERIYWKGYLIDAISHMPRTQSNFIYIELVDRSNEIVNKTKIKREKDNFHGSILLPADIPAGEYYLRAYTQWMMNAGEDYFYYHRLRIGNALDRSIQTSIRYEEGKEEGYTTVKIRFTNEQNKPLPDIRVENRISVNQKQDKRCFRTTNANGEIYFDIPSTEEEKGERTIKTVFKDGPYKFDKTFYVPLLGNGKKEFALSFFPEGGELLDGCNQRVAFKAQQVDGNSCEVQGYLQDESGDTISTLRTEHDGMGVFTFTPSAGAKYKVTVSRDSLFYREFRLSEVKPAGLQLSVHHRKGMVRYNIMKARQTQWQDTLYLVGHTRGNPHIFIPLTAGQASGRFYDTELPEGITELLLLDKAGTVLSRRLLFIVPDEQVNVEIKPFPSLTERRKYAEFPIQVTDTEGNPIRCSLSVSLTDRNTVIPDSLADNIRSAFLLTSDLKGYIENPGYYFGKDTPTIEHHTELLLLTHGWARFRHSNVLQPPPIGIKHLIEVKQVITGRATKLFGRKAKKCPVILVAPKQEISAITYTDQEGNFAFREVEYCDTVTFAAQARSKAGRATVFLEINSVSSLSPHNPFPARYEENSELNEYDWITRNTYLNEGGMQVVRLKEVTITASKIIRGSHAGVFDHQVSGERLERLTGGSAYDLLYRIPKVRIFQNKFWISSYKKPALLLIDGMYYLPDEAQSVLQNISSEDVEIVEVLLMQSAFLFFGRREDTQGAIVITLKSGANFRKHPSRELVLFTKQGYTHPIEFYHPVYQTPEQKENEKPDIRTTVYWNPNLQTDENGKAVIRFYTPDNVIEPHLIIEGVSANGHMIRLEK